MPLRAISAAVLTGGDKAEELDPAVVAIVVHERSPSVVEAHSWRTPLGVTTTTDTFAPVKTDSSTPCSKPCRSGKSSGTKWLTVQKPLVIALLLSVYLFYQPSCSLRE